MYSVFNLRPKHWRLTSISLAHSHSIRFFESRYTSGRILRVVLGGGSDGNGGDLTRRQHSTSSYPLVYSNDRNAAASIWHVISPAGKGDTGRRSSVFYHRNNHLIETKGEGSWNVAWDARPARWLRNLDSAWWLLGGCASLAVAAAAASLPCFIKYADINHESSQGGAVDEKVHVVDSQPPDDTNSDAKFNVTAVPADGRCLFRSIAHVACLRRGEEVPNEIRQMELADELRTHVVDELLRRREEAEWYIEGDFDAYIQHIQKPYAWGGEPELLMASHVIKTPISVYMIDRSSGCLKNIANYGEEYMKDKSSPINVLFHGYGHYDILDVISEDRLS